MLSENELTNVPRVWRTSDVDQNEAFDYYREGICASFMPLRPELDKLPRKNFEASVLSHQIGEGTLNFVSATAHQVNRGSSEIAASAEDCYYLNLQIGGECRISQNGKTKVLRSGEVGIFDSNVNFQLYHDAFPRLKVASLMLRKQHIAPSLGTEIRLYPFVLSHHPVYGRLITETMKSLAESISWAKPTDIFNLQELIISLIGLSVGDEGQEIESGSRAIGQLARVKSLIRARCTKIGYNVADCAAEAKLSQRYIHNLFELDEDSFGTYLIRERLNLAAKMLQHQSFAHLPASTIAFDAGFKDQSHFSRTFLAHYRITPGRWRKTKALSTKTQN